jgi:hypothetical protein
MDQLQQFRLLCYQSIDYARYLEIPPISDQSENCLAIVETRILPHIEFNLRYSLHQLDGLAKWSVKFFCAETNFEFVTNLCGQISPQIKVIKMPQAINCINDYNQLMLSVNYWEQLECIKTVILQEDSLIFRPGIEKYLQYDFIGAQWPSGICPLNFGNGGFGIRNVPKSIEILRNYSPETVLVPDLVRNNMTTRNIIQPPEDIYFSHYFGTLPDICLPTYETAGSFSVESFDNSEAIGGHQFWIGKPDWINFMMTRIVKLIKPNGSCMTNHRSGWSYVSQILHKISNSKTGIQFIEIVEFDAKNIIETPWIGVSHLTVNSIFDVENIQNHINNQNVNDVMKNCKHLFVLSTYMQRYWTQFLHSNGIMNIPITVIYHPTDFRVNSTFDFQRFINNKNRKLLQLGCQGRRISSFFLLKAVNYKKVGLWGRDSQTIAKRLMVENVIDLENIQIDSRRYDDVEYDTILSENIAFMNLYDASACNSIIEIIARQTPLFVNPLPAVIEYLGPNYPGYYQSLEEVESKINDHQLIQKIHEYLKNSDDIKQRIMPQRFLHDIINAL